MKKLFLSMMVYVALMPISVQAVTTYTVTTCTNTNVQNAINSAVDGDTVWMNCATGTWSGNVTIANKSITLKGNGMNNTVITANSSAKLTMSNTTGKNGVLQGFKITGSSSPALIVISGGSQAFRVTDVWVNWSGNYGLEVSGFTFGVIDHCKFEPTVYTVPSAIYVDAGSTATAYGNNSALGMVNNVYVEDSIFYRTQYTGASEAIWAQNGGSYVFRHNTCTNYSIDMHGHCSSGGGREFEIYDNTFIATADYGTATFVLRGGTGVVYNNTFTSNGHRMYAWGLRMQEVDWGSNCNTSTGGACHACTYPALYQLGRGKNNSLDPIYFWNNKLDGSYWVSNSSNPPYLKSPYTVDTALTDDSVDSNCNAPCGGTQPAPHTLTQLNRDYYDTESTPKPGYTAYTYPHPLTTVDAVRPTGPVLHPVN
jgi:hypothetical protein